MYKAHFDASFDRHTRMASLAFVIYNSDNKLIDEEVIVTQVKIALITLLKRLKQLGIREEYI